MKRACYLLSAVALFGWTVGAEARRLPNRAQVEIAVNAWFACPAGTAECGPPFRRRLSRSHCLRLPPDNGIAGRILCLFSGINIGGGAPTSRFSNDCVYMMPARRRGWRVSSIPDADVCE